MTALNHSDVLQQFAEELSHFAAPHFATVLPPQSLGFAH